MTQREQKDQAAEAAPNNVGSSKRHELSEETRAHILGAVEDAGNYHYSAGLSRGLEIVARHVGNLSPEERAVHWAAGSPLVRAVDELSLEIESSLGKGPG